MSNPLSHRVRRSYRKLIAVILTTIYLIIALSPLAPLAMHSKAVAHAVTGECVGDCRICGCSPEARANHTCCCAKKKLLQAGVERPPAVARECGCAASKPVEPVVAMNDCCARNKQHQHEENIQDVQHKNGHTSNNTTVLKCGCPCGKGKLLALTGLGSNELLPVIICERIEISHVETLFADLSHRLSSRQGEPPDPPPKLPQIS
jgi:hypothetical protein